MPRTDEPTKITEKGEPRRRERDARDADVGLSSRRTEELSEGVGYAEEKETPETEHRDTRERERRGRRE